MSQEGICSPQFNQFDHLPVLLSTTERESLVEPEEAAAAGANWKLTLSKRFMVLILLDTDIYCTVLIIYTFQ